MACAWRYTLDSRTVFADVACVSSSLTPKSGLTPTQSTAMTSATARRHTRTTRHNKYARATEKGYLHLDFRRLQCSQPQKILLAPSQFVQLELSPNPASSTFAHKAAIRSSSLAIVQVVKSSLHTPTMKITRRTVEGTKLMVAVLVRSTQGDGGINTAYLERLNAIVRQRLACLARRSCPLARRQETLHLGMYLVGTVIIWRPTTFPSPKTHNSPVLLQWLPG